MSAVKLHDESVKFMPEKREIHSITIDRVVNGFIVRVHDVVPNGSAITHKPYVCLEDGLTHLVCKLFFHGGEL